MARPKGSKNKRDWDLKTVSMKKSVEWVFNALGRNDVIQSEAPGPGAWALYSWVIDSAQNKAEFYKSFATKMLPSRTEIDVEGKRRDDGEDPSREAIARIFGGGEAGRSVLEEDTPDSKGEPGVEGWDSGSSESGQASWR